MIARAKLLRWGRIAMMAAVAAAGFAIYVWGAVQSPVLDASVAREKAYVDQVLRAQHPPDRARKGAQAGGGD